jgi:hypothetical protein
VYALTDVMKWNLPIDPDNVSTDVAAITNMLSTALGVTGVNFIKVPVLYGRVTVEIDGESRQRFLAHSANVANCLVIPNSGVYMQTTGSSLFDTYITGCLSNAVFIDIWDEYHCHEGEVHCGTATRRTVDLTAPWWQRRPGWQ